MKERIFLFTTDDFIKIYVGDTYYWIHNDWTIKKELVLSEGNANALHIGWNVRANFSTEKEAKNYVMWNKPTLALKDIAYKFGECGAIGYLGEKIGVILKLVKSRI